MDCLKISKAQMLIIIIYLSSLSSEKRSCSKSLDTVRKDVTHCPKTRDEWLKREKMYNCSSYKQNCVKPELFVYHCIPTAFQNESVEVCAIGTPITGYKCAEFNFGGEMVQEHNKGMCQSCPFKYNSIDAFKYRECFAYEEYNSNSSKKITRDSAYQPNTTTLASSSDCTGIGCLELIGLAAGSTIVLLIGAVLVYCFRKRRSVKQSYINREKDINKEVNSQGCKPHDSEEDTIPLEMDEAFQSCKPHDSEEDTIPLEMDEAFQSIHDPLYAGLHSTTDHKYTSCIPSNHSHDKILSYEEDEPVYKYYTNNATRLHSFSGFSLQEIVEKLANAGFFYEGYDSSTACFQCGHKKDDWGLDDDPILEHIRLNNKCTFARSTEKTKNETNLNLNSET